MDETRSTSTVFEYEHAPLRHSDSRNLLLETCCLAILATPLPPKLSVAFSMSSASQTPSKTWCRPTAPALGYLIFDERLFLMLARYEWSISGRFCLLEQPIKATEPEKATPLVSSMRFKLRAADQNTSVPNALQRYFGSLL